MRADPVNGLDRHDRALQAPSGNRRHHLPKYETPARTHRFSTRLFGCSSCSAGPRTTQVWSRTEVPYTSCSHLLCDSTRSIFVFPPIAHLCSIVGRHLLRLCLRTKSLAELASIRQCSCLPPPRSLAGHLAVVQTYRALSKPSTELSSSASRPGALWNLGMQVIRAGTLSP